MSGNQRNIIGLNRSVLRVEAAFRIRQLCGVNAVAFFEAIYAFTDCRDRAGSVSAEHVWECGFDSRYFDESTFTLIRIPSAYSGSFDPNQDLVRFYLGNGQVLNSQCLGAAKLIESYGPHCLCFCL